MGLLVEGQWQDKWYDTRATGGRFERQTSVFRHWVTTDGGPGPSGEGGFPAAADRYHLYVSYACPWAHRTLIFRRLKDLEDMISVSVVEPEMLEHGWEFKAGGTGTGDTVNGLRYLHQLYTRVDPNFTGRVTVPVLWDKLRNTIVNNESAEIIRMLNSAFDHLTDNSADFYPPALRAAIDSMNQRVYDNVNNGVYRCGFASTQAAYEEAFDTLFDTLDFLEQRLAHHRYLVGEAITEADWRLFTTLVRFDAVYHGHFKCNRQRLVDFPNLFNYLLELYQFADVAETVHFDHIKRHYYFSHKKINPTQIVPKGPVQDLTQSHDRWRLA